MSDKDESTPSFPHPSKGTRVARGALQIAGGAIPGFGGLLSAAAGAWSEGEQAKVNRVFEHWIRMLQEELREKERTIVEIMARLDMADERVATRVESPEYQSLVRKAFRDWAGAEGEEKRVLIRNLLSNAGASDLTSDDVIRMFIDWIKQYSPLHFAVIAAIYNSQGVTRGAIWRKIGKGAVREDSADADLYKLLFRDLSTGGVVRQHREKDYYGNFVAKTPKRRIQTAGEAPLKSAFDEDEQYELTDLGRQFVHYAMTELPPRIEFNPESDTIGPDGGG